MVKKNHSYILLILLLISIVFVNSCDAVCGTQEADCQVYLQQNQKSPYRNVTAKYSGWHFAGHIELPACWKNFSDFCKICEDSEALREKLCAEKFPGFSTRPGQGVRIEE